MFREIEVHEWKDDKENPIQALLLSHIDKLLALIMTILDANYKIVTVTYGNHASSYSIAIGTFYTTQLGVEYPGAQIRVSVSTMDSGETVYTAQCSLCWEHEHVSKVEQLSKKLIKHTHSR